ncbi:MAG: VOC family protein [Cytophagia bacterium]|nr:VOC family protein [Cytophagia bacterium]NVK84128.1 VOC family protein [Cytophagia bacterium]
MDKSIGSIGWIDLTVPNASEVKDFYSAVIGWKPEGLSMGDYEDFNMTMDGEPKTGICHKKGPNANIPSQWMIYINVADMAASTEAVEKLGGKLLSEVKSVGGYGKFCIIEDPAGAVCTLFEPEQD